MHGWSFHLCGSGKVVSGTWPDNFASLATNAEHINFKELWVAKEALAREADWVRGWRVLFRMDNSAAVHYVNIRHGRILSLQDLSEQLEFTERSAGCWALAVHLAGSANVISDAGSRDANFVTRWQSDPLRLASLKKSAMQAIVKDLGPFTFDLFADREGVSAQAPNWCCPEDTAFEACLKNHTVWVFPPRELCSATLKFLAVQLRCASPPRIVLLLPSDPGAHWFRSNVLKSWKRRGQWKLGADIFRVPATTQSGTRWSKASAPCTYLLLSSF
jgi:hypothetical protein